MTISSLLFGAGLALLTVWFISRPFRAGRGGLRSGEALSQRGRLLARKADLYDAIREIDSDVQVGKLEPADHRALRQRYVTEAVEVLKSLDALPAESAVDAAVEADLARLRSGEQLSGRGVRACPQCGVPSGPDDRFCARCGAELES